ncbi:hypothetical protein SODALDRAFT_396764 [Sodiomyces alkalinus F11]|uniref:Uncharacterized protein n=1 Tax=Sodiomyces alkalinus (strain CBS 110278 / VKM F-3762 / F11) TaxID=1314773 RepID=A0A3N2Q2Y9_SODAK|nr:hypothetical protein SODALDRAFT_396764 [Sodiomyces alkalinus F11]ROT41102.1 hypothetical protein SODALDRAFT_396764 [Sodiomyces alkalinus F11]
MTSGPTGFPSLQPALIFKVDVGEGNPVGDVSTGSQFLHFQTPTGTIKSVPGFKPEIDASVVFGGDWLYFDPDKSHARVNFKGIAKTKEGVPFSFYYGGIVRVDEGVGKVFAYSPEAKTIPFGSSTTAHTFEVGNTDLKVLENAHWVGNGRFILGETGLTVESRVSKVIPSTDMD